MSLPDLFSLKNRCALITGGCGLLGRQHAEVIAKAGGTPVLADIATARPAEIAKQLSDLWQSQVLGYEVDITFETDIIKTRDRIREQNCEIDILINNASNNPKVENASSTQFSRIENFPIQTWNSDIGVGLTGAFLCSKVFGPEMANRGRGVIINIASDLALISPDQRLYRVEGVEEDQQPVKPVTYSVIKSGLIGLTRYLATYWAHQGVRVNAISPGGVYTSQPDEFVHRLSNLIPMGRMAKIDEYQGAILFLCSDASSYMNGANVIIDGGRTTW